MVGIMCSMYMLEGRCAPYYCICMRSFISKAASLHALAAASARNLNKQLAGCGPAQHGVQMLKTISACSYGSVPCVRRTGGLADTVFDVDDDEGRAQAAGMETNGYIFEGTDATALDYALNR